MSLRLRIALVVAGVVAVVVVAVGVSLHRSTEAALIDEVDDDLIDRVTPQGPADRESRLPGERFRDLTQREAFQGVRTDPFGALVGFDALARVVDADGNVRGALADDFEATTDPELLAAAAEGPVLGDGTVDGSRARVVTVAVNPPSANNPSRPNIAYVQLARPLDEVDAVLASLRRRTMLLGGLAILAAAAAGWVIASLTARPIRRLTDVAEHIAATGDLSHAVESAGSADEVGRLGASFNTMLEALSASRRQQRRLVMDAGHELRTPLTSLRTNIDVLRRGHDLAADEHDGLLADIDSELTELTDLVTELVDLAIDVRSEEALAPLTLAEIAEPVVERARRRSEREIHIEERRSVVLEGRPDALTRAIRNLVDNACKFSPPGTAIRVEIDGGSLAVHDRGAGIPAPERDLVFERFHRVESTRTMPGSGLGLAIVRQVAEAHEGRVFATESPDGGAAVGFVIPTVDDTG